MKNKQIEIFLSDDGQTQVEVCFEQDTLWLSQSQMAELFDKDRDTIGLHLKNIYESGELDELITTEESSVVRQEGGLLKARELFGKDLQLIIDELNGYHIA